MILLFDTETTGLPEYKLPHDHPSQPNLVQLAALLLDDDGVERASFSAIVRPAGWTIPAEASAVHGITTETAEATGLALAGVLAVWSALAGRARVMVGHNVQFDWRIMRTAAARVGGNTAVRSVLSDRAGPCPQFCTMKAATPIVGLPPTEKMRRAGFTNAKSASLSECVRHFFQEEHDKAHDALADVRATARLYLHLRSIGAAA